MVGTRLESGLTGAGSWTRSGNRPNATSITVAVVTGTIDIQGGSGSAQSIPQGMVLSFSPEYNFAADFTVTSGAGDVVVIFGMEALT
jgi:hypothetical protein